MAQKSKYPYLRVSRLANQRADEIVKAFQAQGIETSKAQLVSDLILSMPIPQPIEKKRTRKAATVTVTAHAGAI